MFDIELGWDNRQAAASDNVNDCLSYADISEAVVKHVEGSRFALVERVAEEVAEILMSRFKSPWVRIKVSKTRRCRPGGQRGCHHRAWPKSEIKTISRHIT
ncbi:Dihydroneopterin aldolase [Kluyvera cryocrescens]|uniref:dihydroneopterin aldolase n=1 Tax=Kluyvera cryocrescens TaxID=580 RepID=A0A485AH02_KLUCR|nr:Dihydroneopterin aldolase [Kluyvera cryocrescens]